MCGLITAAGKPPPQKIFEKARDAQAHRGPDDAGLYYDARSGIALGHRRLSIIDLSAAGRQPMWSADGRYAVVFNGEIYNYRELKKEIGTRYAFRTETDTEVLMAAYSLWGKEALAKLNGMFAFVVWDVKEEKLFGARDRLGIKPLYYHRTGDALYCASEIKGLLALGVSAQVNDRVVYEYLANGLYDHTDETFFDGILKLPAGHCFEYRDGSFSIMQYWDIASGRSEVSPLSLAQAKERFLDLFTDSIRLRLRSDVAVGVNLSSGLDSASILYFAEKAAGRELDIFSMCSVMDEYNECALVEPVLSSAHKRRWHTSTLKPDESVALLCETFRFQDEPFGGIPTAAYHKLAQLEKEKGVTVILEGQGGDELFGGYRYYLPEFLHKAKAGRSQDTTTETNARALRKEFTKVHVENAWTPPQPLSSTLLNTQYRDLMHTKLPRVLRFNDRLSMAASREYREPLLDHRLVEFCFFLPDELKIRKTSNGYEQKVLLREAMKDIVPARAKYAPKKTFGSIQVPWFREHLKDFIMGTLSSRSFGNRPYWDQRSVLDEASRFFTNKGDNSFYIWQWVNFELWLRKYFD